MGINNRSLNISEVFMVEQEALYSQLICTPQAEILLQFNNIEIVNNIFIHVEVSEAM